MLECGAPQPAQGTAGAELPTTPLRELSSPIVPALLIATKAALLAALATYYALRGVSSIKTLSSGALTYSGVADKTRDYAAGMALVLAAVATFICAYEFFKWAVRCAPASVIASFHRLLIFANLPAFFALGMILFNPNFASPLLYYSMIGEFVLLVCFLIYLLGGGTHLRQDGADQEHLFNWILPVLLFSLIAGATTPSSWAALWSIYGSGSLSPANLIRISEIGQHVSVLAASLSCMLVFALQSRISVHKGGSILFAVAQLYLLVGVVRLVGTLVQVDGRLDYAAKLSNVGIAILVACAIASIAQVIGRTNKSLRSPNSSDRLRRPLAVTTLAAALAAILLKGQPYQLNLMDDYHTGEFVLPYWSWRTFGLLPYVDLAPARGWINLLYGFVVEEGLGSTYGSYAYVRPLISLLTLAFLFAALRWAIGTWPALFLTALAPAANGVSEIDVVNTALLAILCRGAFVLRPTSWLVLWAVLGTAAVLFAPGQGALLVVATGFLGLWQFYKSVKNETGRLLRAVLAGVVTVAALALLTPFLPLVTGAVRYGLEQSQANTEANAIAWAVGRTKSPVSNSTLWEVSRSAWLFVTAGIGMAAYIGIRKDRHRWLQTPHFVLGIPLFVLGALFVFRAGGRIDAGSWTRLGLASTWFITLALPLYVFFSFKRRTPALMVAGLTALAGSIPVLNAYWDVAFIRTIPVIREIATMAGGSNRLDELRAAALDPSRIENVTALKRFADSHLKQTETFLDLTNRNTLYYFLDRRPPIEVSVYNLTNIMQQLRTIRTLQVNPPRLVLAHSDTIRRHDGGSVSLRANLLYRYVLENYRPVESGSAIWLIRSDKREADPAGGVSDAELKLLVRAFAQQEQGFLPSVWGNAWNNLIDDLDPLLEIDLSGPTLYNIRQEPDGMLISTNRDPQFIVDIAKMNVSGSQAGLLVFDFECVGQKKPAPLQVFWRNERVPYFSEEHSARFQGRNGRLVVPLDSSPSWVLGGDVQYLRFDLADPSACDAWRITNAALTQRASLETMWEFHN